ncbi:MAG TPA: DUF5077 domain-containing protein, partial [Saprospiraceae bacterium]|nr:DUF5077 domain-containing protein [Saprospiraceae bacterium]
VGSLLFIRCTRSHHQENAIEIATEGNSWYYTTHQDKYPYSDIKNTVWIDSQSILRTYFRVESTGILKVSISLAPYQSNAVLEGDLAGKKFQINVKKGKKSTIYLGKVKILHSGYYHIDIKGISKDGEAFPAITHVQLSGSAIQSGITFNSKDYFYWGRRGPSVHLRYDSKKDIKNVAWFYN